MDGDREHGERAREAGCSRPQRQALRHRRLGRRESHRRDRGLRPGHELVEPGSPEPEPDGSTGRRRRQRQDLRRWRLRGRVMHDLQQRRGLRPGHRQLVECRELSDRRLLVGVRRYQRQGLLRRWYQRLHHLTRTAMSTTRARTRGARSPTCRSTSGQWSLVARTGCSSSRAASPTARTRSPTRASPTIPRPIAGRDPERAVPALPGRRRMRLLQDRRLLGWIQPDAGFGEAVRARPVRRVPTYRGCPRARRHRPVGRPPRRSRSRSYMHWPHPGNVDQRDPRDVPHEQRPAARTWQVPAPWSCPRRASTPAAATTLSVGEEPVAGDRGVHSCQPGGVHREAEEDGEHVLGDRKDHG